MADADPRPVLSGGTTIMVTDAPTEAMTRCLETVMAGLGTHDRIVVLSESPQSLGRLLQRHRRMQVEPHPRHALGRRVAAELRAGARAVVVLDGNSVVPTARNLADLVATAEEAGAGAAAPLTNGAPWPQCPSDTPDHTDSRDDVRNTAALLSRDGRTRHFTTTTLDGQCIAITPRAADALDMTLSDFSTSTLARAVRAGGHALVVAQGSYVHGTHGLVLVSACMIMRDEVENLPRCLGSLETLADEIVIYDTGSTDGSIELARAMGATVVGGYWDDDFARARNAAREACRGTWVLHIDPDEWLEFPDTDGPRAWQILASDPPKDLLSIPLRNLEGSVLSPVRNPQEMLLARLFRRRKGHWVGAIHEHPAALAAGRTLDSAMIDVPNLLHSGYLNEVIDGRGKRQRNLRIASGRLQEMDDKSRALFEHARSLVLAGDRPSAIPVFRQSADAGTSTMFRRGALEHGALSLIEVGRFNEALEWLDELETEPEHHVGVVRWFRARALLCLDQGHEAWEQLDGLVDYNDRFSNNSEDQLHAMKAGAKRLMGEHADAARHAVDALAVNLANAPAWRMLSTLGAAAPSELERLAALVPADRLTLALAHLLETPADGTALMIEAMWRANPGHLALIAFATDFVRRADPDLVSLWQSRIASAGITV